ncbi:MAG: NTP transferase domain-containing protein [Duncaniella sp.]|nr:NTP transferase domain-containing protein [Duncaniella sp.]
MNYVILAAGMGSRFTSEGVNIPKPLVPLMGRPMIGRLIGVLRSVPGCGTITVVANPRMPGLVEYLQTLQADGAPLCIRPAVTDNSYTSLRIGAEGLEGPFVAMTVDAVFPTDEFSRFVGLVERMPQGQVNMALTRHIDDETPLYARLGERNEVTDYHYGGEPFAEGAVISAGVYGLTNAALEAVEARGDYPGSLSDFQRILAAETAVRVCGIEFSKALDVDSTHDCRQAETFLREVNGERPPRRSLKEQYAESLKSLDTEEHIDLAFYRPIGFGWAILFRRLGVSPNAVTLASIFIGIAAGICFYPTTLSVNVIGMFLLVWANSFDSADGQLARLTGRYSRLGRILDGLSGDFWFASIYIAICLRTVHTQPWVAAHPWTVWTIAVLAGICHAKQAALADYYRQFHLFFLKGHAGSELDSSAQLESQAEDMTWRRSPLRKLIALSYSAYTRSQEAETPAMQALRRTIAARWHDEVPASFRECFLDASRPLCKWENFLTFNWRTIFLFISLFAGIPWSYFIIELTIFNGVMIFLNRRHERLCHRLLNAINSD